MNTEPPPLNPRDLMNRPPASGEGPKPANRLQKYMEKHAARYRELQIDEVHGKKVRVKILVPLTELEGEKEQTNTGWYTGIVRSALEKNDTVFGTVPQEKTYLFVETTQDWNDYVGDDQSRRKTKGDRHHGLSGTDILCFTPPGMRNETNAEFGDRPASDYVRIVLDHETAHASIEAKYGELERRFPNWISEGVPMLVCTDLAEPVSPALARRMYGYFSEYPVSPSDTILGTDRYEGREDKSPVMYTYGEQFLKWVVLHRGLPQAADREASKAAVVPLLDRLAHSIGKPDFPGSFRDTFGMEYGEAYRGFVSYLKEQAG